MQIEVNKNDLAGALSALGKLICRTSPVEAYKSVQIAGKENKLHLRTAGTDESIEFTLNAELEACFTVVVNFEAFRQAVRGGRGKSLVLESSEGAFFIDGRRLPLADCEFPPLLEVPDDAKSELLPVTFVEMLNKAAPIVNRSDYRKVLQGINLSHDGITATNGKALFHVPLPMEVENLTIPFPLALIAFKASGMTRLCCRTNGSEVFFRITAGNWCWSGKALKGVYPNWKIVMPDPKTLTHSVEFSREQAAQLQEYLKSVPDDAPNNGVELCMGKHGFLHVRSLKGMETDIPAVFGDDWGSFRLLVNRDILLRLLSEGHTRLACSADHGPFLASGGMGQYLAMPLYQQEPKQEPQKEESKMNETEKVVSAPVQTVARNHETELNPMEELSASIEEFKLKLKGIFEESNNLSRKVKEVAISQKQKERDFIVAKRAIERIRMAI